MYLHSTNSLSVLYMNSKHDYEIFSFIYWYITLRRVRNDEKPSEENVMDLKRCNLGNFLAVPSFVARRLQVLKDDRDPSGESWNHLSRSLSSNFEEMTVSTPFRDRFLDLLTYLGILCSKINRPVIF